MTELVELLERELPVRSRYEQMYQRLVMVLNDKTRELTIEFAGTFARLDYLCRQVQYREQHPRAYRQICAFRGRCTHLRQYTDDELNRLFQVDMRALCEFLAVMEGGVIPQELKPFFAVDYPEGEVRERIADCLRCLVDSMDDDGMTLTGPLGETLRMPWTFFVDGQQTRSFQYLRTMMQTGSQLNLIRPWVEEEELRAEHVILEPDLLVDISTIASCFQACGASAWHYLFHLLDNEPRTSAQLLGNLAGQMLDEEVHRLGTDQPISYSESVSHFFADNALAVVTCHDLLEPEQQNAFHAQARQQQQNLRQLVHRTFAEDRTIDLTKVVLEPSFYCEMLGLQGRMDLLQSDKHVLMEQKSGKMDEYRHTHQKANFVQVLLYQAMLHFAYRDADGKPLRNDDIATYLLYSRYPDGLLKEAPAPRLLEEALQIRNQIAFLQSRISRGEARMFYSQLTPECLNTDHVTNRLWTDFVRPRLDETLQCLNNASPLEQDYFYRMLTFVAREHMLSKVGTPQKEASGFAALWNSTSVEKREAGDLLDHLIISQIAADNAQITLAIARDDEGVLPNFRVGDIVVLYAYPSDAEPDARRDMVFRANIVSLSSSEVVVRLRAPQKNLSLFHPEGSFSWALEHDFMESSYNGLYRGLYAFLQAPPERRNLLLAERAPRVDTSLSLKGDYGAFNDLVLRAKQAQDWFLLVGPPGTGKTSCGLVNILHEAMLEGQSVLLVSYTNRAVDEICSKLLGMQVPFVRIGSELSCAADYRPCLLSQQCRECRTAADIRQLIQSVSVVVGTTTAMTSNLSLFELKAFDLCVIDEASQILEPHLLPLLCARHGTIPAIRKFVMIGDHKQLPAVVQQSCTESEVRDPALRAIGLEDCRQSLFERLLRQCSAETNNSSLVYILTAQGRMHHDVAAYPNLHFYGNSLVEVPLKHQQRPIPYHSVSDDPDIQMLCTRRLSFIHVAKEQKKGVVVSDKVNEQEARRIARLVYACWQLYAEDGLTFRPSESVGVIVPYRHQISTIRKEIEQFGIPELLDISIDTVERYQGSQRDIIIYGFTVCRRYQLDFLTSARFEEDGCIIDRKLNVAMTRARESMILLGDAQLLGCDLLFCGLLQYRV